MSLLKWLIILEIQVTNEYHDLEKEEVNIIAGALELRRKTVGDIMTRLEDVFMLSYESVLDFETVSEIMKQGDKHIPLFCYFQRPMVPKAKQKSSMIHGCLY